MLVTDRDWYELERDPQRLKAYYWRAAMNARGIARRERAAAKCCPFADGPDLIARAERMERFATAVLENIDRLVAATLKREQDHGSQHRQD